MAGHASVGDREWFINYAIGDTVYHVTDIDKKPGVVTQIILQDSRVVYCVEFGSKDATWFSAVSLSREHKPDYVS